ncbi:unnamed protein product [Bursaphelenchus okinawaensis]|uniref:Tyrosine-protein kinase n=1 Tax=Bursaphelenchus okinawaensis TaxID=465554 RepID=A0A811L946_9BILA|nr:unnamed protein product [Bursaphelenchus okinawaensis]CAG9118854.1 unnamed protein product [Bursaphelenchus okinawaensis]
MEVYEWTPKNIDTIEFATLKAPYYHGLLSREDTSEMLKESGDYLVRYTENEKEKKFQLVLSVLASHAGGLTKILNFKIDASDQGLMLIGTQKSYPTLEKLISALVLIRTTNPNILTSTIPYLLNPVLIKPWEVHHEEITQNNRICEGQFGDIYSGTLNLPKKEPQNVIVKVINLDGKAKLQVREFLNNARMMRILNHNNILKCYAVAPFYSPYLMALEIAGDGGLKTCLRASEVDNRQKIMFMTHAACGLDHIHKNRILHRYIAATNCLVHGDCLKLSGFSLAIKAEAFKIKVDHKLPFKWCSPESLITTTWTQKCDVWSFGVLCWEIFSNGAEPYGYLTSVELIKKILRGDRLTFPDNTPSEMVEFINKNIWSKDKERFTAAEVLQSLEEMVRTITDKDKKANSSPEKNAISPVEIKAESPVEKAEKNAISPISPAEKDKKLEKNPVSPISPAEKDKKPEKNAVSPMEKERRDRTVEKKERTVETDLNAPIKPEKKVSEASSKNKNLSSKKYKKESKTDPSTKVSMKVNKKKKKKDLKELTHVTREK